MSTVAKSTFNLDKSTRDVLLSGSNLVEELYLRHMHYCFVIEIISITPNYDYITFRHSNTPNYIRELLYDDFINSAFDALLYFKHKPLPLVFNNFELYTISKDIISFIAYENPMFKDSKINDKGMLVW